MLNSEYLNGNKLQKKMCFQCQTRKKYYDQHNESIIIAQKLKYWKQEQNKKEYIV